MSRYKRVSFNDFQWGKILGLLMAKLYIFCYVHLMKQQEINKQNKIKKTKHFYPHLSNKKKKK